MTEIQIATQWVLIGVVAVLAAAIVIYFVADLLLKLRGRK